MLTSVIFTFFAFIFPWVAQDKPSQQVSPIVEWANHNLPHAGVLEEGKGGYVYLKVDDAYVEKLFPMISNPLYIKPPSFRRHHTPGAHISVFYPRERDYMGEIEELGQQFSFTITRVAYVPERTRKFVVLEVHSPSLENLREKYGLSPLLQGHPFHITIAKKRW